MSSSPGMHITPPRANAASDAATTSAAEPHVLTRLPEIVPSENTAYGELDVPHRRFMMFSAPVNTFTPEFLELFKRFAHEHPFAHNFMGGGDGAAMKISDFLAPRQFRRTCLYNESQRYLPLENEIVVWLPAPQPHEITFALHRKGRDFSERERLILNVLRPHLAQAYRNAEAVSLLGRALATGAHAVVLLDHDTRIGSMDSEASPLLREFFGVSLRQGDRLPDTLGCWIQQQERLLENDADAPPPLEPLVVSRPGCRLTVRLFAGAVQRLLLLEEERDGVDAKALASLGLTRRETEVLAWVAEGKTNAEIATILGISGRTVAKHLEMMYQKLGVENRTAAAARALSVLQEGKIRQP